MTSGVPSPIPTSSAPPPPPRTPPARALRARRAPFRAAPLGCALEVGRLAPARGDAGDAQPVEELVEQGVGHAWSLRVGRRPRAERSASRRVLALRLGRRGPGGALSLGHVPAGPSLYRRHRPRTFADVIGQEHVVRTLRNAIEQGKVHHAYLFVGSRGTGKTSMAKMLAACLNCVNGPTTEPCGVCESCVSIAAATSMDVIEMDAASNNSVDDIRDLRDSVQFAPVSGGYKVYILDEAHMLSPQAWNAFLKTLEEPPPATIFVLATTEANKVMPTVV